MINYTSGHRCYLLSQEISSYRIYLEQGEYMSVIVFVNFKNSKEQPEAAVMKDVPEIFKNINKTPVLVFKSPSLNDRLTPPMFF